MKKRFKRGLFLVMAFIVASAIMLPSGAMAADKEAEDPAPEPVTFEAGDAVAEAVIEEMEENRGAVLFASADGDGAAAPGKQVELSYSRILRHENWFTRFFTVEYDGKTRVAYCVEPEEYPPEKGEQPAVLYNNVLMKKALYYSYGYPGYETVTKTYLEKCSMASCYKGNDGAYILSHIMLSYLYDNESPQSDAFKGISSDTQNLIRGMVKELRETWPEPPGDASLELDVTECKAEWNREKQVQETDVIKLKGHRDNSVTVTVPEDVMMTRLSGDSWNEYTGGSVEVHGGDEFFFTAGASKTGVYESGLLQGCLQTFQPYMIQVSEKQDIMYCGGGETAAVSFKIIWQNIGKLRLKKISASPEITDGSDKYSLKDAVYGIYDEDGNKVDEIITDEQGIAEILMPYGVYILKELKSPIGYMLDGTEHEIVIDGEEINFDHEEQIIPDEPVPQDDSPQTGDELPQGLIIVMAAVSLAVMTVIAVVAGPMASGRRED